MGVYENGATSHSTPPGNKTENKRQRRSKQAHMKANPDTLHTDLSSGGDSGTADNLQKATDVQFFTSHRQEWMDDCLVHFGKEHKMGVTGKPYSKQTKNQDPQIYVPMPDNANKAFMSVTFFDTGIVMVQGEHFRDFPNVFPQLKANVLRAVTQTSGISDATAPQHSAEDHHGDSTQRPAQQSEDADAGYPTPPTQNAQVDTDPTLDTSQSSNDTSFHGDTVSTVGSDLGVSQLSPEGEVIVHQLNDLQTRLQVQSQKVEDVNKLNSELKEQNIALQVRIDLLENHMGKQLLHCEQEHITRSASVLKDNKDLGSLRSELHSMNVSLKEHAIGNTDMKTNLKEAHDEVRLLKGENTSLRQDMEESLVLTAKLQSLHNGFQQPRQTARPQPAQPTPPPLESTTAFPEWFARDGAPGATSALGPDVRPRTVQQHTAGKPQQDPPRKKRATIIGSSMVRDLGAYLDLGPSVNSCIFVNPGSKIEDISQKVKAFSGKEQDDLVGLHLGSNNIVKDDLHTCIKKHEVLMEQVSQHFPCATVVLSGLTPRLDSSNAAVVNNKVENFNAYLRHISNKSQGKVLFVDNFQQFSISHLESDGLHLKPDGSAWVAANLKRVIERAMYTKSPFPWQTEACRV